MFQNHQLDENLKKTLNIIFYNQSSFSFSIFNDLSEQDQNDEKQQNDSKFNSKSNDTFVDKFNNKTDTKTNTEILNKIDSETNAEISEKVLKQLIKKKYEKNEIMQNIIIAKLIKLQKLS